MTAFAKLLLDEYQGFASGTEKDSDFYEKDLTKAEAFCIILQPACAGISLLPARPEA